MGFSAILLNAGLAEIVSDIAGSSNVKLNRYRIGRASGVLVPTDPNVPNVYPLSDYDRTDVVDFEYEGNIGLPGQGYIAATKISDNEVRFVLVLNETVGDFEIGNVMLYDDSGSGFIFGSLPTGITVQKYKTVGTNPGNRVVINLTVAATNLAQINTLNILASCCECIPSVPTQVDLPLPGSTPYDVYIVQNHTEIMRPFIAFRHFETNTWHGLPFSQSVESLDFGVMDGGTVGDIYQKGAIVYNYGLYWQRIADAARPINSLVPPNWIDFDGQTYDIAPDTIDTRFDFGTYV